MFTSESHPRFPSHRRRALLPALAVGLTLLSACGTAGSTEGAADAGTASVASLATPAASATDQAAPAKAENDRPLIRSDTSDAEKTRLFKVYLNCLADNGVPRKMIKMFEAKQGTDSETAAKYDKQCGSKEPEQIYDKARASDPEFADHQRAEAKCLNDHGVPVEITKDGQIAGDGLPPQSKAHWLDDCEQKAFADYYRTLP